MPSRARKRRGRARMTVHERPSEATSGSGNCIGRFAREDPPTAGRNRGRFKMVETQLAAGVHTDRDSVSSTLFGGRKSACMSLPSTRMRASVDYLGADAHSLLGSWRAEGFRRRDLLTPWSRSLHRRHRVCLAALRGAGWNRSAAEATVRLAAAGALEGAAAALRQGAGDDRVRALVDRALRRLSLVADLETGSVTAAIVLASADIETHAQD